MTTSGPLAKYKAKRNFAITPEPAEGGKENPRARQFVVQKHWATRLHYDLRIELEGTMKSWAVPKGPSYDHRDRRMAIHVEDHPISYNSFEGQIPPKQYGAGKVIIWDKGTWAPLGNANEGYRNGHLKFELHGHKLRGRWALVRINSKQGKQDAWLLIKERDPYERPSTEFSVVDEFPDSVAKLPPPEPPLTVSTTTEESAPAGKRVRKGAGAAMPAGAVQAETPSKLAPVLATLVDAPPARPAEWLYEIKFDGYRMLARIDARGVRLLTRNGHDWSSRLPHLVTALERMKLRPGWLDGEIVVLNESGTTDFQALQNAFDNSKTGNIVYFLFDVPYYDGYDLTGVALTARRELLQTILAKAAAGIRFSEVFDAPPRDIVASACKIGLEGIIAKRKDSTYSSRRSPDWIKLKCSRRQEFVIGGYTDPQGSRTGFGGLLVGVNNDKGELVYAGKVGTGFNEERLRDLLKRLQQLATDERPFKDRTENDRRAHWVKPELVAEVTFSDWTAGGHIRHPSFKALRTDKPAKAITREVPVAPTGADLEQATTHTLPPTIKVSNPERVIDPASGITKVELVRFYGLIAPLMMEHLKGRPISLVRAPTGVAGELFFQKHLDKGTMTGIRQLAPDLWPGYDPLLEVATPQGLPSAAQMNAIEIHTWNAVKTSIDKPDRMTFDLDPGEGVDWPMMQRATKLVHVFLQELGLASFCKTSGGKGLHVVVPLRKNYDWDTVKDFSEAIVRHLARTLPKIFVAKSGPRNRIGRIFIDYLRNGFGATTICAWSARARHGLGVSVPIEWSEVDKVSGGSHWSVQNIRTRLDKGNEPWKGYAASAQGIAGAMKALGFR